MKRLLAYLFIVLGLGLTFSVNAKANNYCIPKKVEYVFQSIYIFKDCYVYHKKVDLDTFVEFALTHPLQTVGVDKESPLFMEENLKWLKKYLKKNNISNSKINKSIKRVKIAKKKSSQTQKVAKEKSEDLYVERMVTKQEKLDFAKGKIKIFRCSTSTGTHLSKDDCFGDYYKKELLKKNNLGFLNFYLLKDYTKTQIAKAEPSQTQNSEGIIYKVIIIGNPMGSSSGQFNYFNGLSKINITDALKKAKKKCNTHAQLQECKIYSGRKIFKDDSFIKFTKSEIRSGKEPSRAPKKKVKVAKVEEPKQEEFKPKKTNQDNEAPVIEIAEAITVNDPDYEIEGKVSDKADKIFVEVDGKPSEVKDGKFKIKRYSPVDHQIKIVAIDQWGNRSKEKIVNVKIDIQDDTIVELEPLNPLKFKADLSKKTVALIIGVENYENTPAAKYASLDAKYFTEYAKNVFGVNKNNIKLLTDEEANLSKTNSAIFKWLPSKIKENETDLIVFYSGHGLASNDGKSKYILPSNADPDLLSRTAVSRNEFFDQIVSLKPKSVTIFFDTCYSGVSRDEEMLLASAKPLMIVAEEDNKLPDNFTIFTASQLDQISSGLKEAKHGIFSYYLMKGLEGNADINKDSEITNAELLAYMDEKVSEKALDLGRKQNPSLSGDPDKVLISYK